MDRSIGVTIQAMGMGPGSSSLLRRLERAEGPPEDDFWYAMEQQDRQEQRKAARIRYAQKHKAKKKPLAPVGQTEEKFGGERCWVWQGEDIESKKLKQGLLYTSKEIRSKGFKLPPLAKKEVKGARGKAKRSKDRSKEGPLSTQEIRRQGSYLNADIVGPDEGEE